MTVVINWLRNIRQRLAFVRAKTRLNSTSRRRSKRLGLYRVDALERRMLLAATGFGVDANFGVQVTSDIVYRNDAQVGYGTPGGVTTTDLFLDLYTPTGADLPSTLPGAILIHGGGFTTGDKTGLADLANEFASRGYVTVSINYRMDGDNVPPAPPNPPASDDDPLYDTRVAAIADTFRAIEWMKAPTSGLNIDPNRIVIGGSSAGSFLASFGAVLDPADVVGLTNESLDVSNLGVAALFAVNGGTGGGAVIPFVDSADPPTFIAHAQNDPVVPISNGVDFANALDAVGVVNEFPVIADGGHSWAATLSQVVDGKTVYQRAFEFFNTQLDLNSLLPAVWSISSTSNSVREDQAGSESLTMMLDGTVGDGEQASVQIDLQDVTTSPLDYENPGAAVVQAVNSYVGPGTVTFVPATGTLSYTGGPGGTSMSNLIIPLHPVDDALVEGDESFSVSLLNPADSVLGNASQTITIQDDDSFLTVTIAAPSISEGIERTTTATVSRSTDTTDALTVSLFSSDTTEATVPTNITIGAGAITSEAFEITAINDLVLDGTQTVTITAQAAGHVNGENTVDVAEAYDHRISNVTVRVVDQHGNPLPNAVVDLQMTEHAYKFGTQVRDRLFSISQTAFDNLSETQKQRLLPNLNAQFGTPVYTPVWQDVLNYRDKVFEQFNNVVPTTGLQWVALNNNGPAIPDAAFHQALAGGLSVTGASVVWQRDRWPTPNEFRPAANPDPAGFHSALLNDRLSSDGVLTRYSNAGAGPEISDWKLLNEPIHETYYSDTFVNAGIYADETDALADYFFRARALRPDAILSINDFNILNWQNDNNAIAYRDLINNLLAVGAPIDRIGVQAHIGRNDLTRADIIRRLDILAETGLLIEITEFDSRDDAGQLTPTEQEQIFRDILEVSFEHPAVDGFVMWGIWDPGHWRGNAPLYDIDWNIKAEAAPWFDLVRGAWMSDFNAQNVDGAGEWTTPHGTFDGVYQVTATHGANATTLEDVVVTSDAEVVVTIQTADSEIVGRHLFYNNSPFDDPGLIGDPAVNANDDGAIATDKVALQAGTTATFTNYSSYSRGINGIMIDIDRGDSGGPLIAEDFEFKVGNTADPSTWAAAPIPNGFAVRPGAGVAGSDRVTFTWADGTIKNQWLQVTVKANANTGLANDDVHYWGHQFGETGNNATTTVNFDDTLLVLNNPSGFTPALIDNPFDINRDARVNFDDTLLVLNNPSGFSSLLLFNPPAPPPPPADSPAPVSSASALVEVADSTVAETAPVQPVMSARNHEPSSFQSADEQLTGRQGNDSEPVVQTVASESSSAESSRSPAPVLDPTSDSDDLWIAPPGEITLGGISRERPARLGRRL